MKTINIEIPDGKRAEWIDDVLTLIDENPKGVTYEDENPKCVMDEDENPKCVTERIKTFVDAVEELGVENQLVREYFAMRSAGSRDLIAYLRLRIICAALNEGWQPKFTKDEWRYYPWFWLYTKDEVKNMSEEDKKNLVIIDTNNYDTEYAGFTYAYSYDASAKTTTIVGHRLCLKNHDLAEYCGKQFIYLWANYLLKRK